MVAATPPHPDPATRSGVVERFDRTERTLHWVNAALFAVLLLSGAALYFAPIMAIIGRRRIVEDIHLGAGLALPLPVLAALSGRWGRALRADIRRFNRWTPDDRAWLRASIRSRERRLGVRRELLDGKFNAGQKLNSAFTAGVIVVMLVTGVVMYWYHPWPLSWRTGATYTHDWLALLVVVAVTGHIGYALRDPDALRSMWTGLISRSWARVHAGGWLAEIDADQR